MSLDELRELMTLKSWNEAIVAGNLHLSEGAVLKWFQRGKVPDGPATVLLIGWLRDARTAKERREKKMMA